MTQYRTIVNGGSSVDCLTACSRIMLFALSHLVSRVAPSPRIAFRASEKSPVILPSGTVPESDCPRSLLASRTVESLLSLLAKLAVICRQLFDLHPAYLGDLLARRHVPVPHHLPVAVLVHLVGVFLDEQRQYVLLSALTAKWATGSDGDRTTTVACYAPVWRCSTEISSATAVLLTTARS